jgi:predicted metal-dependent peptidase
MRVEKYISDSQGFAATDGYRLYLNEGKMNILPEETLNFILLHELFHIILYHRYPKDITYHEKVLWNISFDLIVNWLIQEMEHELRYHNIPILPSSNTYICSDDLSDDPSHKIANAFIQQTYQQGVLSEQPPLFVEITWKSFNAQILNTADFIFDVLDHKAMSNAPTYGEISDLLASCAKSAGNKGIPQHLKDLMNEFIKGRKLPWFLILKRFIETSMNIDDADFCPPDNRLLYRKTILPASNVDDKALNNALIVLDVSSSVDKDELLAQLWQVNTVLCDLEFSGFILSFGSTVYQEKSLTDKESLKRYVNELNVGGGTEWSSVVHHIKENYPTAKPIIVFTDGYFFSFESGLKNVIFIVKGKAPSELRNLGNVIET